MRDGTIPPTIGIEQLAEGIDVDVVTESRSAELGTVLINARGIGGFNSSMVLTRPS